MRYRVRTLLIVLALGPPMLAYAHWQYEHRPGFHIRQMIKQLNADLASIEMATANLPKHINCGPFEE